MPKYLLSALARDFDIPLDNTDPYRALNSSSLFVLRL